jgi:hypothetical protein
MTIDNDDLINSLIASLGRINMIQVNEMPNIDLYMDQLTTFMDERLKQSTRYPDKDKILTKTMINNYAKNDLLPPPIRKKYSKDHLILLIIIYYYKNILSINDIQTLIEPLKERFHVSDDELSLSKIYQTAVDLQKEELDPLIDDLKKKYEKSGYIFEDKSMPKEDQKRMRLFAFIALLTYDVYIKKMIIEKILDNITEDEELSKENRKVNEKKPKK